MVRHVCVATCLLVILALSNSLSSSSVRAATELTATVAPGEVTLAPGAEASGVLLVTNIGPRAATGVTVSMSSSDASIDVIPKEIVVGDLVGGSAAQADFTVTRSNEGHGLGSRVLFVVSYSQATEVTPTQPVSQLVVATLDVKAASQSPLLEAKFDSSVETISENRPGQMALVITNPRDAEISVESIRFSQPDSVTLSGTCPGEEVNEEEIEADETEAPASLTACSAFIVPSRSQTAISVRVEASSTLRPGPRSILATIESRNRGTEQKSTLVATTGFTVEVFAESEILKGLGVPAFLLLPGLIIVVVAGFLIRYLSFAPKRVRELGLGSPVEAVSIAAVASLGISLLMAAAYPKITTRYWPDESRDYLKAYGFQDFYYVFAYCFVIAALLWLAAFVLWRILALFAPPTAGDKPMTLLAKLALRSLVRAGRTVFPLVRGKNAELLVRTTGTSSLLVPPIDIRFKHANAPDLAAKIEHRAAANDAAPLFWLMLRAKYRHGGRAAYNPAGTSPRFVPESGVSPDGERSIVSVVPDGGG